MYYDDDHLSEQYPSYNTNLLPKYMVIYHVPNSTYLYCNFRSTKSKVTQKYNNEIPTSFVVVYITFSAVVLRICSCPNLFCYSLLLYT